MKGYAIPDNSLLMKKGYKVLYDMYARNPVIHSSVDNLRLSLLDISRRNQFIVNCSNRNLMPVFNQLISDHPIPGLFGYDYMGLRDFLSSVCTSLLIYGKVFTAIDFVQEAELWKLQRLRVLPPETMNVRRHRGKIQGFYQQYSNGVRATIPNALKSVDFTVEEIFYIEWVFDKRLKAAVSPLAELVPHAKKHLELLNLMSLQAFAIGHPEDHSYKVERSRYKSFEDEKDRNDESDLIIRAKIGAWADAPMTEYYTTYRFARCRHRVALIREYLVEQFNHQVVYQLSRKNGLDPPANVELSGYLTSNQISEYIDRHKNLEISSADLMNILLNDMHTQNRH